MLDAENASPICVDKSLGIGNEKVATCVKDVLNRLGSERCTVDTALVILEKAKEAVTRCTVMQTKYINELDT